MPEDIQALIKQAIAFFNDQKWDQAIEAFSRVLSLIKDTPSGTPDAIADIYRRRGLTYVTKGDHDRAIKDFDEALKLRPNYVEAYFSRGAAYINKDDYDRAIKDFDEALRLQPDYADAYLGRGLANNSKGDHDRAIKDFDEALKLQPDHVEAYSNRGVAHIKKNDYDHAIKDFDEALKLQPNRADAYLSRGLAYSSMSDYDRAIKDFDEALKLQSDYAEAYYGRGNAYLRKGDHNRAIKDFDEALKLQPDHVEAYSNRGVAHIKKNDYDHAIKDFDETLKLRPDYANAYYGRGVAYGGKGDYDRAVKDFDEALKLQPDHVEAYSNRGVAHIKKNDYDHAIKDFDEVLKRQPDYAEAYYGRGNAYISKGNYDRAIKDFDEVLKRQPDYAEVYYNRGLAYGRKGDHDHAIEDFSKANKCNPGLILTSTLCYITSRASSKTVCLRFFGLYFAVYKIKCLLVYRPSGNSNLIAHYTNLKTLKSLVQKSPFYFYNAAYMSDPEEGKTLLAVLEKLGLPDKGDKTKGFLSGSERSPAYVGSFVKTETGEEPKDEKLFLWRTYGKHDGQEAGGACLHFDISQFSGRPPEQLGGMYSASSKDFSPELPTLQKECIYKVAYKSDTSSEELSSLLNGLRKSLNKIRGQGWDEQNSDHQLAREILDEIRFLFKADHYREEKELRIVKIRYSSGEQTKDVKVDNKIPPPRFYMEAPLQLQLKKIILGPQARGFLEWKLWIKKKNGDLEVKQSSVKYGSGYS